MGMALPDWLSDLFRDEPLWKQVGILKQSVRQIEIWRTEEFAADLEQRLAKREKQIHEEWNRWMAETEKSVRARVETYGAQHSLSQTEKTDTMPVLAIDKMLGRQREELNAEWERRLQEQEAALQGHRKNLDAGWRQYLAGLSA